ncbi:conserved hypothetical protein [Bathymodiolus platifrons methanotrophic gill symbiont]|uniref:hypothetical protein n=1 Tax=Bathymodiolus platifrons methanotrophic gill symbiont TaxID=113268 RepID=UPI000B41A48B|nr:hypothetical protein [Bathymodiolus platifrons methanotrophic gill symbiont]MCK5870884.1 hypothetical protein [Methyloprofundus sp.]TXK95742.1 hypothetical protein BMR10_09625 [Methylococcaceae bacterium CS4]TXK96930.1 hypothetical protein BMR11_10975 [Methylococcaceae bacterium CS5]TXL05114.1 hypothetical protein BMR09_10770 [Methylococcaceae bacterium CS3]TXL08778.1 hypothetical protein BMR07_01190 [Methylococcaceae bacterium CS1]TXL10075.1 hypothetical protein BMR08_10845 [Methylococcac
MNINKLIMVFILTVFSSNLLAYGSSSSSKKACTKPKFTQFTPPHLAVVAVQSEFSFQASMLTNPDTIKVSVKKIPVEVTINKENNAYSVSGKLPESLTGTYARIKIDANGTNNCKGSDGWLLNIEG